VKLRAENDRLRIKLAQAEAIIDVQGKVHALLRSARRRLHNPLDAGIDALVAAGIDRKTACAALGRSRASH
jgi:hypothetical protein